MKNMHEKRNVVKIANCWHKRGWYEVTTKLAESSFVRREPLSVCIIQMVVPMFDASLVNAQLGPVCKELWLGEVVCILFRPHSCLKVLNGTLNSQK